MPAPLLLAAGALGGASALNAGLNFIGGNKAAGAQRRAQGKARTDLNAGYDQAQGYQQPIMDAGMGQYTDLAKRYSAGDLTNPQMNPYQFDPQSVFQDPEYQASMRSGTEAINSGANSRSMLFSGQNQKDLQQFGQDTFAKRSDALYDRGFTATNTAFDQNARTNLADFNMGNSLAQPGLQAAGTLSQLSANRGQDLANNSLGTGQINAQNINNQYGSFGQGAVDLANVGMDAAIMDGILGKGQGSAGQGMAGAPINSTGQTWQDQVDLLIDPTKKLGYGRNQTRLG